MLQQMTQNGEETGNIEDMMDKVADYYEEQVDMTTEQVTTAMEPLTMVVMAGIVGIIVAVVPQALTLWGAAGIGCLKELLARI